jgi:tetratricopeptide (TPR) repeat protein
VIQELASKVEEKTGSTTIISLYLKQFQISVLFQQQADFDAALVMVNNLIEENLMYFEGNEITETLVDPYMIAATIYMQLNQIKQAEVHLKKAQDIIQALNGDINEKMLEIYTVQIQLNMIQQHINPVFDLLFKRTALALNIYGIESE